MNKHCKETIQTELGTDFVKLRAVGGGDFAQAYQATLGDGRTVFVKTHDNPPPDFFSTEAAGLAWLRASSSVSIPNVLAVSDRPPFLVMQWIDISAGRDGDDALLGQQLARLHQQSFACFGRPDGRTTGSIALPNSPYDTWVEFYGSNRLLPLAKIAHDREVLPSSCIAQIETLVAKLGEFGAADEPPSLLHGDLWAGNRVIDVNGASWLIDPAAHGGHREFDLAMMHLFGGYNPVCFSAYNDEFPLHAEWRSRIALHQLAPLIVHAIKFGGAYSGATQKALAAYV